MKTKTKITSTHRWVIACLWFAVVIWMVTVTWLSSKPGSFFPRTGIPNADKMVHTALYMIGAFFVADSLRVTFSWPKPVISVLSVVMISLFGIVDEIHQLSTPGRSGGDVGDWTADTVGAILGVLALNAWVKRSEKRRQRQLSAVGIPSST